MEKLVFPKAAQRYLWIFYVPLPSVNYFTNTISVVFFVYVYVRTY